MRSIAVITVDGVLRDASTSGYIALGQRLYLSLAEHWRLALIADEPIEAIWLAVNGFSAHQTLVQRQPEDPGDNPIRRIRQVERLRAMGADVGLLVDPDPAVVAAVSRMGVPCLLYVDPPFARPEWRPDYWEIVTPWSEMVAELDRTRALRAADTRYLEDPL
ncbi:hypothetical protein [Nonomuraea typhae]|uniref:Uncharacterized protein n=1 Tax=Nonomuraea typhae TaxID=2603600 RepID=A0ABW7YJ78_9ACTN